MKGFKIKIISVGNQKDKWMRDITSSILNGANALCKGGISLESIEVLEESIPKSCSRATMDKIKDKEGERILQKIHGSDYVIALHMDGEEICIEKTGKLIKQADSKGYGAVVFVIGGSMGLSENVMKAAKARMSFSKLTYPHQLVRIIIAQHILEVISREA